MTTYYATDDLFIEASQLGEESDLDQETILPDGDPHSIQIVPIQSPEGKTPVPPEPLPCFRRYNINAGTIQFAGEPVAIEQEKPYWRLLTVLAPILPAALEFSYDRLFRDPDAVTISTNLIRIPIGPNQVLWARMPLGGVGILALSVLVDPWLHRR